MTTTGAEVRLARRRDGADPVTADLFEVVEADVPDPGDGEVLVRTDHTRISAALLDLTIAGVARHRSGAEIGAALPAPGVGTVLASRSPGLAEGDLVTTPHGLARYGVGPATAFRRLDPLAYPRPSFHLAPGVAAYRAMAELARVGEGDVVYVSGAAGGVGSLAGQIARARGAATVIGSAGSPDKVAWLCGEVGYDAAVDHHDDTAPERLRALAPDGLSVFLDLVGGSQFEAGIAAAGRGARVVLGGAVSGQTGSVAGAFPALDLRTVILRGITLTPLVTRSTPDALRAWDEAFRGWLAEGRMTFPHTVVPGGPAAVPDALAGLARGRYRGAVIVALGS